MKNTIYCIENKIKKRLKIEDFGFFFIGDGFFTTSYLYKGKIILLEKHIERLEKSSKKLFFNKLNFKNILKCINIIKKNKKNGVIKITVYRIRKNFGYLTKKNNKQVCIISYHKFPKKYINFRNKGISLGISKNYISRNTLTSKIKHTNKLEQVLISFNSRKLKLKKIQELIVLDYKGYVIECISSNIFWRKKNLIYTPSLKYSGVDGIIRKWIISYAPKLGFFIKKGFFYLSELLNSDEIFISNSLIIIASVKKINNIKYKNNMASNKLKKFFYNKELNT
ncbi:MAG: aminodeoxychorismate lyase [Enterobacteriaceae bacterium]